MKEKERVDLTKGSEYKIISLGARDGALETEGIFKGFMSIGVDEPGLLMELSHKHGEMSGKTRIIPLHVVLAIDILNAKEDEEKEDHGEISHYVG